MMAVSDSGRYYCLGGKERLGVFEDKAQFTATPKFKGIKAIYSSVVMYCSSL